MTKSDKQILIVGGLAALAYYLWQNSSASATPAVVPSSSDNSGTGYVDLPGFYDTVGGVPPQ